MSIPSNIAEGSSRSSEKDYHRFLEVLLGSAYELERQLLIAEAVNYESKALRQEMIWDVQGKQKMLVGLVAKLGR